MGSSLLSDHVTRRIYGGISSYPHVAIYLSPIAAFPQWTVPHIAEGCNLLMSDYSQSGRVSVVEREVLSCWSPEDKSPFLQNSGHLGGGTGHVGPRIAGPT